jgi:uncharacterized Zn finger protein
MSGTLAKVLNEATLRRMAGPRSFDRGEGYFEEGAVRSLAEDKGVLAAKVVGTREYRVRLWPEGDELDYSCTCPVGADGGFCKHCVAAGLAWLAEESPSAEPADATAQPGPARKKAKPTVTMDDVRSYLATQDKDALVDIIVEKAMEDDRLRERLLMKVAASSDKGLDLATFMQAIDEAVHPGDLVDYRGMYDYSSGIGEVVDSLKSLLKDGHADAVIELAEHALEAVEEAMGSVDDSDGYMGGILDDLQELHHAACKAAKPDAEALARRLFEWEVSGHWAVFYGAAATYADVLGKQGLAVHRQLAEAEWGKTRALKPGDKDPEMYGKRSRITHIMETLAEQAGDLEALVAVKARDLSSSHSFLNIAEMYQQAGDHAKAIEWAERGLKAFPERPDCRLREFLAEEYHRQKRHDEAMALIWACFTERPTLEQFQDLSKHANRIGQWPAWREKAMAVLREEIAESKRKAQKGQWAWHAQADYSELVRIFLLENDPEAAWREAQEGGCSDDLWLILAKKREKDHPEDAIPVYQKHVERVLNQKNNEAYREAVGLLREVRKLMAHAGRENDFAGYLASVRAEHKPKRNFIKLLDHAKW